MPDQPRPITLSDDHVSRVDTAEGPLHDPNWRMLEDADLDILAQRLTRGRPRPIPIFAYGSLIWNPGFAVGARRRATASPPPEAEGSGPGLPADPGRTTGAWRAPWDWG